jgi:hypothetical protein
MTQNAYSLNDMAGFWGFWQYVAHEGDGDIKTKECEGCHRDYLAWQLVDDLCEACHEETN